MKDTFNTIAAPTLGEYKEKGSKFIAYAFPASTEEEWQQHLEVIKKEHPKSRHHCYAYRLGVDDNNYRANDDGEPSGTAGKPILGQLKSFGVTNTIVIVVRYFGGTLLGASGLIHAYKTATAAALQQATIIEQTVSDIYRLTFDYAIMSNVMNAIKKNNLQMTHQDFGDIGKVDIAIRQSEVAATLPLLKAAIAKVPIEMVADMEEIEGLEMEYLETK